MYDDTDKQWILDRFAAHFEIHESWDAARPLDEPSPATLYLTRTRGIPAPEDGSWPGCFRYDSRRRALLCALTDGAGKLQSLHAIFLTADGKNLLVRDPTGHRNKKKRTRGTMRGAYVAVATPWEPPRGDKSDLNDVVIADGLDAVRSRLREACLTAHGLRPAEPPSALPRATVDELHTTIQRRFTEFFAPAATVPRR